MIEITDPRIDAYLMNLTQQDDSLLLEMEKKAKAADFPIVERLVGRLLYLLTRLKQPQLVVEMGSGFGYSSYWFARALSLRGKIVLIDREAQHIAHARKVFSDADLFDRAEFRVGDALQIAREYQGIDLLFMDLDKHQYLDAITAVTPLLAKNALVIADNTLWHGNVAEVVQDRDTEAIDRFNRHMFTSKDFFTSIVPLRDGVLLAYKLTET
ncbi:O-methyltransferase [Geotalea sp. SG265]|uniref:O-methyltransferase n=1 Tax=Geotalea sp. SG265 TaxID=2922867 RepID=UPI001FAF6F82|nr:O-methyltransferase [Geotalea sp. SG265]